MRSARNVLPLALAAVLAGCGSGGSTPTPTSTPTPSPTPAPTPSPTPTPTPTPTPAAPAGITLSSEAGAALVGAVQYGGNGQTARWATDYSGHFPPSDGWLAGNGIVTPGFTPDYTKPLYPLSADGFDRNSQFLISTTAPAGATVVSPLTGLIAAVGSQDAVRPALQLDSGPYAIPSSTDLLTTSGVGTGSGPILAANVRLLALWRINDAVHYGVGAYPQIYTPFNLVNRNEAIAAFIKANPAVQLYTEAGAQQLLRASGAYGIDDASYQAFAHLVSIYAQATTAINADPGQAARYTLGIEGFLDYWIRQVRSKPTTAPTVLALTSADVAAAVSSFALPPFVSGGTFFAGPQFDFLSPGASGGRANFDQSRLAPASVTPTYGWAENEFTFNPATLNFDSDFYTARIVGVTVPSAFAGKITASASGDTSLVYAAAAGFTGTAYFDYVVSDGSGHQTTARFFLVVR